MGEKIVALHQLGLGAHAPANPPTVTFSMAGGFAVGSHSEVELQYGDGSEPVTYHVNFYDEKGRCELIMFFKKSPHVPADQRPQDCISSIEQALAQFLDLDPSQVFVKADSKLDGPTTYGYLVTHPKIAKKAIAAADKKTCAVEKYSQF
jgi:hypothetical protein